MIKMETIIIIIIEYSAGGGVAAVGGDGCCQCLLHTPAYKIVIIIRQIIIIRIMETILAWVY